MKKIETKVYESILKESLTTWKKAINNATDQGTVDFYTSITEEKINFKKANIKTLLARKEDMPKEVYNEAFKKFSEMEDKEDNVLYMRIERIIEQKYWEMPTEKDFVDGYKYEVLQDKKWISKVHRGDQEIPKLVMGKIRKEFVKVERDVVYTQFARLEKNTPQEKADAKNWLFEACIFDLIGMGIRLVTHEQVLEKVTREKEMVEEEHERRKKQRDELIKAEHNIAGVKSIRGEAPKDQDYLKWVKKNNKNAGEA